MCANQTQARAASTSAARNPPPAPHVPRVYLPSLRGEREDLSRRTVDQELKGAGGRGVERAPGISI
jgi:hypothetical protein